MARKLLAALAAVFAVMTASAVLAGPVAAVDCPYSVTLIGGPNGPAVSGDTQKIQVHSLELTETQTEKVTWKPFQGYVICSASGVDTNGTPWSDSTPTGGSHTTAVGARVQSGVITAKEAVTPTTSSTTTPPASTPTTSVSAACPANTNPQCSGSPSLVNLNTPDLRSNSADQSTPVGTTTTAVPAADQSTPIGTATTTASAGRILALTGSNTLVCVSIAMMAILFGAYLQIYAKRGLPSKG